MWCGHIIHIKSLQNRLLKVCYVPPTSASLPSLLFLLWPLTVLMKQTRQAVWAVKQSILLRCLWAIFTTLYCLPNVWIGPITLECNISQLERLYRYNNLAYWAHSKVTEKMKCCEYGPLSFSWFKNLLISTLLYWTLNILLAKWVGYQGPYSQHSIFFGTYELAQYSRVLDLTSWKGFSSTNSVAYWAHLYVWGKWSVVNIAPDALVSSKTSWLYLYSMGSTWNYNIL